MCVDIDGEIEENLFFYYPPLLISCAFSSRSSTSSLDHAIPIFYSSIGIWYVRQSTSKTKQNGTYYCTFIISQYFHCSFLIIFFSWYFPHLHNFRRKIMEHSIFHSYPPTLYLTGNPSQDNDRWRSIFFHKNMAHNFETPRRILANVKIQNVESCALSVINMVSMLLHNIVHNLKYLFCSTGWYVQGFMLKMGGRGKWGTQNIYERSKWQLALSISPFIAHEIYCWCEYNGVPIFKKLFYPHKLLSVVIQRHFFNVA